MSADEHAVWSAQPAADANRADKLCALCEYKPAAKVCTKCRVTRYCSRECQLSHWKHGHKPHCAPDPLLRADPQLLPLPSYRAFTPEELRERGPFVTLLPGSCGRAPDDDRDALCQLVVANEDFATIKQDYPEGHVHLGRGQRLTGVSPEVAARMGWAGGAGAGDSGEGGEGGEGGAPSDARAANVRSSYMSGFSQEDQLFFRVWYDESLSVADAPTGTAAKEQQQQQQPENLVANAAVSASAVPVPRGAFVLGKVRYEIVLDGDTGELVSLDEVLVPCSVAEVVSMLLWRRYLGSHGQVSSRVFRENMRKREVASYVKEHRKRTQMFE